MLVAWFLLGLAPKNLQNIIYWPEHNIVGTWNNNKTNLVYCESVLCTFFSSVCTIKCLLEVIHSALLLNINWTEFINHQNTDSNTLIILSRVVGNKIRGALESSTMFPPLSTPLLPPPVKSWSLSTAVNHSHPGRHYLPAPCEGRAPLSESSGGKKPKLSFTFQTARSNCAAFCLALSQPGVCDSYNFDAREVQFFFPCKCAVWPTLGSVISSAPSPLTHPPNLEE